MDVFHEWYEHDVGKIYVSQFDNLLGQWLGYPSTTCVHQPTCGQSLVTEANGDVYTCDHFVYPEYKVGNLTQQPLTEIVLPINSNTCQCFVFLNFLLLGSYTIIISFIGY